MLLLIRVSDEQTDIPNSVLFPIQVPVEPLSTRSRQVGVRTDFVRGQQLGLRCFTKIWAICVVEDVSKRLDTLNLEF